ncbi:MAG TPA: hypothetical protein VGA22_05985 [Gemmatimonadales bacterium]
MLLQRDTVNADLTDPIVFFAIGDTAQLIITVYANGRTSRPSMTDVEWEISGAHTVLVDSSRLLRTVGFGQSTVRARVRGTPSNALEIRVARFVELGMGVWTVCGRTDIAGNYCWGAGQNGLLGTGASRVDATRPVAASATAGLRGIVVGGTHACGLDQDGFAFCWGEGGYLGTGDWTASAQPLRVHAPAFQRLTAGRRHTCGLTSDGDVYCWGRPDPEILEPERVGGGIKFVTMDAGEGFTCGLTAEGVGYCWGANQWEGNLGTGSTTVEWVSEPVALATEAIFKSIGAGFFVGCALATDGLPHCWGGNFTPVPTSVFPYEGYSTLEVGGGYSCALDMDGHVYCANNDPVNPAFVSLPGEARFWFLTAGLNTICGVTAQDVRCWGYNGSGTLGIGSNRSFSTSEPLRVARP